jgi:hypothetical protein
MNIVLHQNRPAHHGIFLLAVAAVLVNTSLSPAAEARLLWQIGKLDHDDREFALAPKRYHEFREDGYFVVGRSDARRDWPYVHPGPHDAWAGGRQHTFTIVFGLKNRPPSGECTLRCDLVDTQRQSPPEVRVSINGREFRQKLPAGAGDESVQGQPAKGKAHRFEVRFPTGLLKAGANEIALTTLSGSWLLYDWIGLETPAQAELADVSGTAISSVRAPPVLVERDGRLRQTLELAVRHFGERTTALVRVNGAETAHLTLSAPAETFEVTVPAVEQETPLRVAVEVAGETLARQTLALKPVRKWVVYLLPHSHVDIGYTHVQTEVERAQWKYLETAMDTARKTAAYPPGCRFKWNVEVLWAVDSYLQQATRERREEFFAAVRAGQVGLDALYGNMLTGLCRPEELLRLLRCATELSGRIGVPIESAMITDVPGYTWGIVPAFAHSGVKYFSIGPNGGDRIGHTSAAWGDKPFWWIGPNGKDKLLCWMTGTGYYQVFQSSQKLLDYLQRLEQSGYPYELVQVRHCLGDNGAPDVNFADTVRQWNEAHAYPKLVIATTAEMFRAFERRYGDKLPVAKGDFTPYWEDGAASSARETALNRAAAERLVQAETLFAMLNPKAYPLGDFYRAWRNVVLYDEHTWGAHNSISEPDAPFVKSQWAIKQAFALEADQQSRKLLDAALAGRAGRSQKVEAVDVFNTVSWPRTDLVILPKAWTLAGDQVKGPEGEPVASQRLSSGELVILAKEIPPFGAKRFSLAAGRPFPPAPVGGEGSVGRPPRISLDIDEKTGAIKSLRFRSLEDDAAFGENLVNTKEGAGLNAYCYLPGGDLKGLQQNGPVKISRKEQGDLLWSELIESDAPGCNQLTREIRVIEALDRVDIINTVDKRPVRAKEGVHFGFPFNVPRGVVRMDVPWAVVRPETDQIPGACRNWFTVQRWVDISNDKFGVTWATPDAPLVEVGGITANLIGSLPNPKVWLDHLEPAQTIFSWVMNNHWHTNYRAEQDGPTTFRYSLWPHKAFRPEVAAQFGAACSQPLIAAPATTEPIAPSRLRVEPPCVMVTAFKPSDDGKGWIVRLFGASGQSQKATISWPDAAPRTLWWSDNSERAQKPLTDAIDVPAFGLVTLRAETTAAD